jgi:hypothetical protein
MTEIENMLDFWRRYLAFKALISKYAPEIDPDDPALFKVIKRHR